MKRLSHGEHGYWAFVGHRLSGLALAIFLPLHFLTLALAIEGPLRLDRALEWFEQPVVKFAEWLLVVCLALHLSLGVRLLTMELCAWRGPRRYMLLSGVCSSVLVGALFWVLV